MLSDNRMNMFYINIGFVPISGLNQSEDGGSDLPSQQQAYAATLTPRQRTLGFFVFCVVTFHRDAVLYCTQSRETAKHS